MKGRNDVVKKHEVPLTPHMLDVLKSIPRGTRGPFVFSLNGGASAISDGQKTKNMLDAAICADLKCPDSVLRPENFDEERAMNHFTNHDLRRTLRTMISDLGVSFHAGEAMLAHVIPGTAGVYDHNKRLFERRKAHELWGDFLLDCVRERSNVIAIRKAAAR